MNFKVLFQNQDFVFIDKPAGYFVHPPEDPGLAKFCRPELVILSQLRRQIGRYLYPVHRLDVATSGVLAFALTPEAAAQFQKCSQNGQVKKKYILLARGWIEKEQRIEIPLLSDSSEKLLDSTTVIRPIRTLEVEGSPSGKHSTQRYTLTEAEPLTGRFHQIRRHMNRISHPIIGDNDHGDSRQNRFFREKYGAQGLCLWANSIEFSIEMQSYHQTSEDLPKWLKILEILSLSEET